MSKPVKHLLLAVNDRDTSVLANSLRQKLPGVAVYNLSDDFPAEAIDYAVLWKQPPGLLAGLPALRGITSLGAGVDFILDDPDLPPQIPVARIVAADLKQQMAQYVSAMVTRFHRCFPQFEQQQAAKQWRVLPVKSQPVVGFAGFGQLAAYAADCLRPLGYRIASWTRQSPTNADMAFTGTRGLHQLAQVSDFLINLLPLTDDTRGIFNRDSFTWMQGRQPVFIHVGRGPQVVEQALVEALDTGWLTHAVMDVFNTEPLPTNSPLWSHPAITITPHLAARSDAEQTANAIMQQLQAVAADLPLPLQVDRQRAY